MESGPAGPACSRDNGEGVRPGASTFPGSEEHRPRLLARLGRMLAGAASLAVLASTLFPTRSAFNPGAFECLICGGRGLADAILNVVLFLPLGTALALHGDDRARLPAVLLYAGVLSGGVELAQVFIPGRDASLGDLLFNITGALLGVLLIRSVPFWANPRPVVAGRLSLAAAGTAASIFMATGFFLAPQFPDSTYFVQWTPDLKHLDHYEGRVLASSLGKRPLMPGRRPVSAELAAGVLAGEELRVHAEAGPPVPELAPLFSIYDDRQREILLIGADQEDLVFRFRPRSTRLRLDSPSLRVPDALAGLRSGDRFTVSVRAEPRGYCLGVDQEPICGYGFTLGDGWGLLLFASPFADRNATAWALSFVWLFLLLLPVGYWTRRRWESWTAVALLASALILAPPLVGLRPTPLMQLAAAATGLGTGLALGAAARRGLFPPTA